MRAFRVLAASHILEAEGAIEGIQEYVAVVESAIRDCLSLVTNASNLDLEIGSSGRPVVLAIGSEHGFTGAMNRKLLDKVVAVKGGDDLLWIVGRRAQILAEEMGLDLAWKGPMATHIEGVLETARRLARKLAASSSVTAVFYSQKEGGGYDLVVKRLLPFDLSAVSDQSQNRPLHHLQPIVLLYKLIGEYLLSEITGVLISSFISENTARLRVMDAAGHKVTEKLDQLSKRERLLRQESITSEMLDVVTGVQAILGSQTDGQNERNLS